MKKLTITVGLLLAIVALALVGSFVWWEKVSRPVSGQEIAKSFIIPKGASAAVVGNKLAGEGLINSSLAFKLYVQVTGKASAIRAGQFTLSPSLTLTEVIDKLVKGPIGVWVTIPEGLRREELADIYIESFGLTGEEAAAFRAELLAATVGEEGMLFPDTYLFPREATPQLVVTKMVDTFNFKVDEELLNDIAESGFTLHEILTLASIVEREAASDSERPVIAGILFNRLSIGMALQADATVQYFLGTAKCENVLDECDWWQPPLRGDLALSSPFNTYTNIGLPPAPIASPGLASIMAAINPADTPYFYYLHDREGNVHYAVTLSEHNSNVERYIN